MVIKYFLEFIFKSNFVKFFVMIALSITSVLIFMNLSSHVDFSYYWFIRFSVLLCVISFGIWKLSHSKSWFRIFFSTIVLPLLVWTIYQLATGGFESAITSILLVILLMFVPKIIKIIIIIKLNDGKVVTRPFWNNIANREWVKDLYKK